MSPQNLWENHGLPIAYTPSSCQHSLTADELVNVWDKHWSSIYPFDHGLCACLSIAIADAPNPLLDTTIQENPLWRLPTTPVHTLPLGRPPSDIVLMNVCTGNAPGAWTLSKLLLLPPGEIYPLVLEC